VEAFQIVEILHPPSNRCLHQKILKIVLKNLKVELVELVDAFL
jgi:hypothetical protein